MDLHCSIAFVDVAIIRNVLAHIDWRGGKDKEQPDSVCTEVLDVEERQGDAGMVPMGPLGERDCKEEG